MATKENFMSAAERAKAEEADAAGTALTVVWRDDNGGLTGLCVADWADAVRAVKEHWMEGIDGSRPMWAMVFQGRNLTVEMLNELSKK